MPVKSVHDLLLSELRDLYDAEKQLVKALPKMAKAASSEHYASRSRNISRKLRTKPNGWKRSSRSSTHVLAASHVRRCGG